MFTRSWEPLGMFDWWPGSLPHVVERGVRGREVVNPHLPMLIVGWRSDSVDHSWD
jgi:hypothetical protein